MPEDLNKYPASKKDPTAKNITYAVPVFLQI
jgi:hypothetical protein